MQDNGTVQQLSKALNQLLDAYEKLQEEVEILTEEVEILKEEIDDLELKNNTLDSKLGALNDTSNFHSTEMDTMLGRIENILGTAEEKIKEEVITPAIEETKDKNKENKENVFYQKKDEDKEINLGRMQSLLNGFNN